MRKVHIALVGKQLAPVYNGIYAVLPDVVEFVYSVDSKTQMEELSYRSPCEVVKSAPLSPIDLTEILSRARSLAEKYSSDEVTLNISSGTKSWSHIFGIVFQPMENATVMYLDQTGMLWDYHKMEGRPIQLMDMKTLLSLYGSGDRDVFTNLNEYTPADTEARKKIEIIRSRFFKEFYELCTISNLDPLKTPSGSKTSKNGSVVKWERGSNGSDDVVEFSFFKQPSPEIVAVSSPHASLLAFKSGWFEYKVANILRTWKHSRNVYLNCRFKDDNDNDKNEVDVLVETSSRLLFVECKTSLYESTDVDKFASVVKAYGGSGSLGIFITDKPMNKKSYDKCITHGLLPPFSLKENHGGLLPTEALYQVLNSAISQINM